jgi:4-amino-4-deoxy-L-arabinose transferase-like glycosyltransferase
MTAGPTVSDLSRTVERRRALGALCLLGALLTLPSLPMRDLWAPDEPRYAEVAREMRLLGEYRVPRLNGEMYAEKPPLFFWMSAALQAAGLGPAAGRIVTAGCALGTLLLTWSLGRLWLAPRAALLGAFCLGTTGLFSWLARAGVMDVPLTFFTTLAAYGWFCWRVRGGRTLVLFYLAMGLAILVKGPVGAVVPLLAAAAGRGLPATSRKERPWHLLWGPALTALVVAIWLVPACLHGGEEFARTILYKQTLGRAVASWSHARPFWYYASRLFMGFFPWILVAPLAVAWAWRRRGEAQGLRSLVLWLLVGLLFFSAASGKRERYLLPLYPALAISVGAFLDSPTAAVRRHWARRAALVQHLALGTAGIAYAVVACFGTALTAAWAASRPDVGAAFGRLVELPGRVGLGLAGGAVLVLTHCGWRAVRARAVGRSAWICASQTLVLLLAYDLLLVPRINEFKSPRDVARKLERYLGPASGELALFGGNFSGAYNLYTGRLHIPVLEDARAVAEFLAGDGRRIVLASVEDYEGRALGTVLGPQVRLIDDEAVGRRRIVFLANFDPPGEAGRPARYSPSGSCP